MSQTVVSQLSLLNTTQKKRVKDALAELKDDSFRRRSVSDIKKLVTPDEPPLYRLRIGDYRAIFFVVENEVKVR